MRPGAKVATLLLCVLVAGCVNPALQPPTSPSPYPDDSTSPLVPPKSEPLASNVVIMIGDGMGFNHVAAADLYSSGTTGTQAYEQFEVQMAVSTFSLDGNGYDPARAWNEPGYVLDTPTDSAAAAAAMSTGAKTQNAALGVVGSGADQVPLKHLFETAEKRGKATGVVTTVPFSHATPAGFSVHADSRDDYQGIATAMLLDSRLDVIMGAGHPGFDADAKPASNPYGYTYVGGKDTWSAVTQGLAPNDSDGDGDLDPWTFIHSSEEFAALAVGETPVRVLGVAQVAETLNQRRSGEVDAAPFEVPLNEGIPSLADMTAAALNVLDEDADGFVLVIEGGAIDWASHANQSGRMIEEQMDFNAAVDVVIAWAAEGSRWDETLLVVLADHETGYLAGVDMKGIRMSEEGLGLAPSSSGSLPGMRWNTTHHTNSLVPLFAHGVGARLFLEYAVGDDPVRGPYLDNTSIPTVVRRAAWRDVSTP